MLTLNHDIRFAFRLILRNYGFSLFVVLLLAVGIGANTAIFSMVDAIVLRPLPFKDIDHIVTLSEVLAKNEGQRFDVSAGNFLDWQRDNRVFEYVAAYKSSRSMLTGKESKERVQTCLVSPGFFKILGLAPQMGRYYSDRAGEGERSTAVLSYRFWQQDFRGDPSIIGETINLDNAQYDVIGVAPSSLDFPLYTQVWLPFFFSAADKTDRSRRDLSAIAKIKNDFNISDARNEMSRISNHLAEEYPLTNAESSVAVVSLIDSVNSYSRNLVLMLMAGVGFVLLLACANVANLQLTRIIMRRKEIALRFSLGAGRLQIIKQLAIEGVLLSLLGVIPGLVIAKEVLAFIKGNMTQAVVRNITGFANVAIDGRALGFAVFAGVLSALLFILPAMCQALQGRVFEVLKEESRGSSASKGGRQVRSALVIAEVMLAIILLVGANLMVSAVNRITTADRGFDPANVSIFDLEVSADHYPNEANARDLYKKVLWNAANVSGVSSVGMVNVLPSVGDSESSQIVTEHSNTRPSGVNPAVEVRVISEDYFKTMSIPLKAGRQFTDLDNSNGRPVAIISESAARSFWPGSSALDRQAKLVTGGFDTSWLNIIGVVGDVNYFFLNGDVRPTIYLPYQQDLERSMAFVVRAKSNLTGIGSGLRSAVQQADATLEMDRIREMPALLSDMAGGMKIVAALMMALGFLALALCASGVYAIMSYSVAQQTQEIGIRMALGAQKYHVLRMVFRYALYLVTIGLLGGIPIAMALGYLLSSLLKGVIVVPILSFVWLAILMVIVAVLASYLPARRAIHVAPVIALRG